MECACAVEQPYPARSIGWKTWFHFDEQHGLRWIGEKIEKLRSGSGQIQNGHRDDAVRLLETLLNFQRTSDNGARYGLADGKAKVEVAVLKMVSG